ncbi:MAG: hypothetical protein RDO_0030 [Flavobacteriales endosymbiont of Rhyzopertha dominica]|nr:MAG: hypothetical protein NHG05_00295 [Candidatus Shikimatogenerans bostrichidophilus]
MAHPKKKKSVYKKKIRFSKNNNNYLLPLFYNKNLNKYINFHNIIIYNNIIYYKNKIIIKKL